MQAGDLRDQVAFGTRGSGGEGNEGSGDFADVFTRWANIRPRLGGESVIAARLEGKTSVNITVRRDPETVAIRSHWRATNVATGTVYNLLSVVDPFEHTAQRGEWIECLAEAGSNLA